MLAIIQIIAVQICKIVTVVIVTTSIVYFGLRIIDGDPELAKRGLVTPAPTANTASADDNLRTTSDGSDQTAPVTTTLTDTHRTQSDFVNILRAYPQWLGNTLFLNFEDSYYLAASPLSLIGVQIGRTTLLACIAFLLSLLLAVGLAIIHTRWSGKLITAILSIGSRITITIPEFWLAMMILFMFAIYVPIFPLFGADSLAHYALPLLTLVVSRSMVMFYILDSAMQQEGHTEYILSARIRSVPWWRIAIYYQLRNAITTLIPISVIQFGYLFSGAVIIEQVFGIAGFGTLLLQALHRRDYPVAEASVCIIALIFAIMGIVADIMRVGTNPQLRNVAHGSD